MIVAIHQPNFLPWIGYFYKIYNSDVFVFLDNVQFTKNGYQNRVKIKTSQGENWLTVPVVHQFGQLTNEVRIDNSSSWRSKHLKTLEMNYRKAPYYGKVFPMIENVYMMQDWDLLSAFCINLIQIIMSYMKIDTPLVNASGLNVSGQSTDLLINIVKSVGGTMYLSGRGGSKYQDDSLFGKAGVGLQYSEFSHPTYKQLWGDFCQGLSVIDLLFNEGGDALIKHVSNLKNFK